MNEEEKVLEMIKSNYELAKTGKSNPSKEKQIIRRIRKIKKSTNPDYCLNAAQWVLMYHMSKATQTENEKQFDSIMKSYESDLKLALSLLSIDFPNEEQKFSAQLITCDLAQKLSDFEVLNKSYLTMLPNATRSKPQAMFMALTVAPVLSDWATFYRLCIDFESMYNKTNGANSNTKRLSIVEILHSMAESGLPDYGVIFAIAKEEKLFMRKRAPLTELRQQTIDVKSASISLNKVYAESEARVNEIKELFEKEKENEFQLNEICISVNGGIVFFPGLSKEVPILLVGPHFDEDVIKVEGMADLQLQETDEDGTTQNDYFQEMNEQIMNCMPAEMMDAINSGEISPEDLFEVMQNFSAIQTESEIKTKSGNKVRPELIKALGEMSIKVNEKNSEIMKKFGSMVVRQQERMELKKTESGYEGMYFVRNYNPVDKSEETSISLKLKIECEHLSPPPMCRESPENDVEKISAGLDDLKLD